MRNPVPFVNFWLKLSTGGVITMETQVSEKRHVAHQSTVMMTSRKSPDVRYVSASRAQSGQFPTVTLPTSISWS